MDKIKVIDRDTFDMSLHYGSHFTGYVMGLGYVSWGRIVPYSETPAHPFDTSRYSQNNISYLGEEVFVPNIIPEEDILADVTIPDKDILEAMLEYKVEGKMVMTLFDGRKVELDSQHTTFHITTRDEYYHGEDTRTVTVVAEDKANNVKVETKAKIKDVLNFIGNFLNYTSYIISFMEKHYGDVLNSPEVRRKRPVYEGSHIKYKGQTPWVEAVKKMNKWQWAGYVTGAASMGKTLFDYGSGEISGRKASSDIFFGVVGFAGPVGMLISSYYFLGVSPYIDKPVTITAPARNMNDISFPRDNTNVYIDRKGLHKPSR